MTQIRLFFRLRASILRDLIAYVTSYVLHRIIKQYDLITIIKKSLSRCINVFIKIMSLSCAYKIQERIYDIAEDEVLRIENIHPH